MARQSALSEMEKQVMKTASILRPAVWAGAITLVLGMQAALAEPLVYVPLGGEGKIVVIDAARDEIVDTISGVTAVHGLARTPDGQFLIAGSFEEREAGVEAVAKPSGVSEDEHAAHHGAAPVDSKKDGVVVSTLSVIRTADGSMVRRIDVPGAVHHVAVSPNGRFAVVTHPNEGGISAIDLMVVNLYPFEETVRQPNVTRAEAVEQIDIGGPSMVRSAAKNHRFVGVVTDPADYGRVMDAMVATQSARSAS